MILFVEHDMLVSGPDFDTCERHVRLFFEKSQLVHYDSIDIDRQNSVNAVDPRFEELMNNAIAENHRVLADLLAKLQEEDCQSLQDLLVLPQGFKSKMLHTMSHVLDGFFGIDSRFFDINEISHWLTENRQKDIAESPGRHWLIRVRASSVYGEGFEKKS